MLVDVQLQVWWNQMKINKRDLIGCLFVLTSIALIPSSTVYWLTYAIGCFIYAILLYQKKLYFGVFLHIAAIIIAVTNFIKGVLK